MDKKIYDAYKAILEEELLPAMGCTEPIAVAYAAAIARRELGEIPHKVTVGVSGNILKNVKSVVVPNTGGLKGVASAAAAGIIAGDASRQLEVISEVSEEQLNEIKEYLHCAEFTVEQVNAGCIFDIYIHVYGKNDCVGVRIAGHHTNVVKIEKNGEVLYSGEIAADEAETGMTDRSLLSVEGIVEFADCVNIDDVRDVLERQINYNLAISEEGLRGDYGARVGKVLLASFGNDAHNRAKALAAAGSDARMNGCSLPVVIVSGSGNQGICASMPVVSYAAVLGVSHEKLLRALVVSDLITIHLKTGIGRLSAYCGAVSAGCGAGSAISYLYGGGGSGVAQTIVNALAIVSGMVCDGAKSSCAAKIASSVEAGLLGMEMWRAGTGFVGGDGILVDGVENTIKNVGDLASRGMKATDEEIIRLMIKSAK